MVYALKSAWKVWLWILLHFSNLGNHCFVQFPATTCCDLSHINYLVIYLGTDSFTSMGRWYKSFLWIDLCTLRAWYSVRDSWVTEGRRGGKRKDRWWEGYKRRKKRKRVPSSLVALNHLKVLLMNFSKGKKQNNNVGSLSLTTSWIIKVSVFVVFPLGCHTRLCQLFMAHRHLALVEWHPS